MASSAGGLLQTCHREVRLPLPAAQRLFLVSPLGYRLRITWSSPFFGAFASGRMWPIAETMAVRRKELPRFARPAIGLEGFCRLHGL